MSCEDSSSVGWRWRQRQPGRAGGRRRRLRECAPPYVAAACAWHELRAGACWTDAAAEKLAAAAPWKQPCKIVAATAAAGTCAVRRGVRHAPDVCPPCPPAAVLQTTGASRRLAARPLAPAACATLRACSSASRMASVRVSEGVGRAMRRGELRRARVARLMSG